jgi:drug/metabolite transporter (DMT)-like permease
MITWIVPLILLIIFESLADIFAKEYSLKGHWYFWLAGIAGYIIANIFWLSAIKNGSQLGRGAIIFSVVSAILAIIIGVYFYQENTNKIQVIGMILGVISLVLIFWE